MRYVISFVFFSKNVVLLFVSRRIVRMADTVRARLKRIGNRQSYVLWHITSRTCMCIIMYILLFSCVCACVGGVRSVIYFHHARNRTLPCPRHVFQRYAALVNGSHFFRSAIRSFVFPHSSISPFLCIVSFSSPSISGEVRSRRLGFCTALCTYPPSKLNTAALQLSFNFRDPVPSIRGQRGRTSHCRIIKNRSLSGDKKQSQTRRWETRRYTPQWRFVVSYMDKWRLVYNGRK